MKKAFNYIISGVIFIDAESLEEAEDIVAEISLDELADESETTQIALVEVPVLYRN